MKKYVIIGTGAAGYAAAKAIRATDAEGEVVLIGKEPYPPYHRPRLSHFIGEEVELETLLIEKRDRLEALGIILKLGLAVERIDRQEKAIVLENGERMAYDALLVATGANPFIPPFEGEWSGKMAAIRMFDDLVRLNGSLKPPEEVVVIGGGLLGLEAAWALQKVGNRVRVVEFFDSLLPRQLDPDLGRIFQNLLEEKGLVISLSDSLASSAEEEGKLRLTLKSGASHVVDHLVFSVGVRANAHLAAEAGLNVNRGIVVDHRLQTSDSSVFAAGDAVELEGQGFGLWTQATEQGRIAGMNMAGGHRRYQPSAPFTLLHIAGIRLFSVGEIQDYDQTVDGFDEEKQRWKRLYLQNGRAVGGVLIGDVSQMQRMKRLVMAQDYVDGDRNIEEILV